jgi:Sec-independent protein translocase protein TatA
MADNKNNQSVLKSKYSALIMFITTSLVAVGAVIISIASYFQTAKGFEGVSDPELIILGVPVGLWLPFVFAIVFQYGQNVALIINEYFTSGKVVYYKDLVFFKIKITDSTIAKGIFVLCAAIDAGTNIMWLSNTLTPKGNPVYDIGAIVILYPAMVVIVFVEEGLGLVIQSMSKSFHIYKDIVEKEERSNQSNGSNQNQEQQSNKPKKQEESMPNRQQAVAMNFAMGDNGEVDRRLNQNHSNQQNQNQRKS